MPTRGWRWLPNVTSITPRGVSGFMSLGEGEAAFCRITRMTLLRLLTSPAVMAEEVVKPRQA